MIQLGRELELAPISHQRGASVERVLIETKEQPVRTYKSSGFFVYTTNPVVLVCSAAAPVAQGQVPIQTDSDFELMEITYAADIAAAAQTDSTRVIPLVTLQIVQSGTGIDIMGNPIALSGLAGDGRLPFILPESKIWPASSSMLVTLTRFAAAVDYNIRLAFIGRKLFF